MKDKAKEILKKHSLRFTSEFYENKYLEIMLEFGRLVAEEQKQSILNLTQHHVTYVMKKDISDTKNVCDL